MKMISRLTRTIVCAVAVWFPIADARGAQGEVPYDFFYAALQSSGTWRESADYGYVWQPRVAAERSDWRPYADGYWSHTDQGWTWVSYEEFGWATYHYGRWARLADAGWIWVPGFEWAPAWVSWRASPGLTGHNVPTSARSVPAAVGVEPEEVVGWAPLPPEVAFNPARGISPQVDHTYRIGPDIFNFVPARRFGEMVLRPWIFRVNANVGFMASTWNCTNLIYRANPGFIWAGGPSFWALRVTAQNPIAQLQLVAQYVSDTAPRENPVNRVDADLFLVTAPVVVPPEGISPGSVGLPVALTPSKPPIGGPGIPAKSAEHGWIETPPDSPAAAVLREQIKREAAEALQRPAPPLGSVSTAHVIRIATPKPAETGSSQMRAGKKAITPSPGKAPVSGKKKGRARTLPPPDAGNESASPRSGGAK